jgi:hypothetical protein
MSRFNRSGAFHSTARIYFHSLTHLKGLSHLRWTFRNQGVSRGSDFRKRIDNGIRFSYSKRREIDEENGHEVKKHGFGQIYGIDQSTGQEEER